jgi:NADPH:quinone reductase-like Zn-dependent oxidoreductase
MGTREELDRLVRFLRISGVRPLIDSVHALADAPSAFRRLQGGEAKGKVVVRVGERSA